MSTLRLHTPPMSLRRPDERRHRLLRLVRAAFSHLVVWAFLLGVLAALPRTAVRAEACAGDLLAASFPHSKVRWRDAYGAYLVKNGAGIVLPMHGDDAVRVSP